jgi:hypothetical protein
MHFMVTERQHTSAHTSAHNHQPQRDPQTGRWVTLSTEDIQAQKPSGRNPFYTYRDPDTGQWCVVQPDRKDVD